MKQRLLSGFICLKNHQAWKNKSTAPQHLLTQGAGTASGAAIGAREAAGGLGATGVLAVGGKEVGLWEAARGGAGGRCVIMI